MTDVIDLAKWANRAEAAVSLPLRTRTETFGYVTVSSGSAAEPYTERALSATVEAGSLAVGGSHARTLTAPDLYGTDLDTELSRLFSLSQEAINLLDTCVSDLAAGDNFGADDALMDCRRILAEMYVLRDISDAVGLLSLKCLQAASQLAVTNAPRVPGVLIRVLSRLRTQPFMSFENASNLVDEIEAAVDVPPTPGYNDLASMLVEGAE
jgi:hypothetical protein